MPQWLIANEAAHDYIKRCIQLILTELRSTVIWRLTANHDYAKQTTLCGVGLALFVVFIEAWKISHDYGSVDAKTDPGKQVFLFP